MYSKLLSALTQVVTGNLWLISVCRSICLLKHLWYKASLLGCVSDILGYTFSVTSIPGDQTFGASREASAVCPQLSASSAWVLPSLHPCLSSRCMYPSREHASLKFSLMSLGKKTILFVGDHIFLFSVAIPVLSRETLPIPLGPLSPS